MNTDDVTGGSDGKPQETSQVRRDGNGRFQKGGSGNPKGGRARARRDTLQGTVPPPPGPGYIDGATGQYRHDGYMSQASGFGVQGVDKRMGHTFVCEQVTYREAIDLCRGNDMAKRAISTLPSECFRMGYEVTISDLENAPQRQEEVEKRLRDLKVNARIKEAFEHERRFGGGAVLLGANDGQPLSAPLDMKRVISFDYLTVLEPIELWPLYFYTDPTQPNYGEPSHFQLSAIARGTAAPGATYDPRKTAITAGVIHESRLLIFPGVRVSKFQQDPGTSGSAWWGDSIITSFVEVLRDFQIAAAAVGIILTDFSQLIIHVKNLASLLATDNGNGFLSRMQMMDYMRSTARAVVADAEEQVSRQTTSVTGLRELLDWLSSRLAAAVDMPLTLLMGQSPKGLGNEGDSDVRFFYDRVAGVQTDRLEPLILRVIRLVYRTTGNRKEPEKWAVKWRPLWQPTAKETAEARKLQMETDTGYIKEGVLRAYDVTANRFGGGEYSYETQVDMDNYEEIELTEADLLGLDDPDPTDPSDPNPTDDPQSAQRGAPTKAPKTPTKKTDPADPEPGAAKRKPEKEEE